MRLALDLRDLNPALAEAVHRHAARQLDGHRGPWRVTADVRHDTAAASPGGTRLRLTGPTLAQFVFEISRATARERRGGRVEGPDGPDLHRNLQKIVDESGEFPGGTLVSLGRNRSNAVVILAADPSGPVLLIRVANQDVKRGSTTIHMRVSTPAVATARA